jgi:hypothetical protein
MRVQRFPEGCNRELAEARKVLNEALERQAATAVFHAGIPALRRPST